MRLLEMLIFVALIGAITGCSTENLDGRRATARHNADATSKTNDQDIKTGAETDKKSGDENNDDQTPDTGDVKDDQEGETPNKIPPGIAPGLPGTIEGVEPESHSHHPPMIDSTGTIYRITESNKNDGNNLKMMYSIDGGVEWQEADVDNRPNASDIEGSNQLQFGSTIYVTVAANRKVWFSAFNTSDAEDNPNKWTVDEGVDLELNNSGGVVQFSSLVRTSDGQFWVFYSDTMVSGRQQIGFKRRSINGEWSAKQLIGDAAGSWTGPRAILGKGDVTHIFYNDFLGHALYLRTLDADGNLSQPVLITADLSVERIPHTAPVIYESDGKETIVIAYSDREGILKTVRIVDGVVDSPESVSNDQVLQNPDVAKNDGTVGHLSVYKNSVHAVWTDNKSGDIQHSVKAKDAAWTPPKILWDSGDGIAWWVYGAVFVRGLETSLAITYDVGPHEDDVGMIFYNEIPLD